MNAPRNILDERDEWTHRLCSDREIKLGLLRVASVIGTYLNSHSGDAWPSQSTIAAKTGMTRPNVNTAIARLVALGYLTVRKEGQANHYQMGLPVLPPKNSSDLHNRYSAVLSPENGGVFPERTKCSSGADTNLEEPRLNHEGAPAAPPSSSVMMKRKSVVEQAEGALTEQAGAPKGASHQQLDDLITRKFGEVGAVGRKRISVLVKIIGLVETMERLADASPMRSAANWVAAQHEMALPDDLEEEAN